MEHLALPACLLLLAPRKSALPITAPAVPLFARMAEIGRHRCPRLPIPVAIAPVLAAQLLCAPLSPLDLQDDP
ncbi:hypothetical protein AURDEDRAFT_114749 [Auricularia subglabra TFB-10046 SS5]|nr:hypothetical protein AURDEDRAFT_114749 [Auricularia subglabra TFB-10046 SS5]